MARADVNTWTLDGKVISLCNACEDLIRTKPAMAAKLDAGEMVAAPEHTVCGSCRGDGTRDKAYMHNNYKPLGR